MTTADLSSECPLRVAEIVRADVEATLRALLGAGWPCWRLRAVLRDIVAELAAIERKPTRVARFVAGERLEDAVKARGDGVARGGGR